MDTRIVVEADRVGFAHEPGGARRVLEGICLRIAAGETLALLGPRGAGKSTLLALLAGRLRSSYGRLLIRAPIVEFEEQRLDLHRLEVEAPGVLLLDEPFDALRPGATAAIASAIQNWSARGGALVIATRYLAVAGDTAVRTVVLDQGRVAVDAPTAELLRRLRVETYLLRVRGHLPPDWADFFDGFTLTHLPGGESILVGPISDQAALQGMMATIQVLGLELCAITRIDRPVEMMLNHLCGEEGAAPGMSVELS